MSVSEEQDKDRQFVVALARGLQVLSCFKPSDNSLSNQEISARTGLAKPTVSRLTYTLMQLDYLVRNEATGQYRLGVGVLTLGHGVLASMSFGELAAEAMQKLCNGPNPFVTCGLGERYRLMMITTAVKRSQQVISLTLNVGARLPLFHSAMGRAILAALPATQCEDLLQQAIAKKPKEESKIKKALEQAQSDFQRYGYCTSFGDWSKEINGIAIPLRAPDDGRLCAINIGAPSFLIKPEELHDWYGDAIKETASTIGGAAIHHTAAK